jgi:hypothetical protein
MVFINHAPTPNSNSTAHLIPLPTPPSDSVATGPAHLRTGRAAFERDHAETLSLVYVAAHVAFVWAVNRMGVDQNLQTTPKVDRDYSPRSKLVFAIGYVVCQCCPPPLSRGHRLLPTRRQ